jgi:hypothetical protein
MVSFVVELLAHARNDQYRRISSETILFSKPIDSFRLGNEDEGNSLAETSTRIVLSQFQYSTNPSFWDWERFESTYHPPFPDHSCKFHALIGGWSFEKNILAGNESGRLSFPVLFAPNRHFSQRLACETQLSTMRLQHVIPQLLLRLYELQKS